MAAWCSRRSPHVIAHAKMETLHTLEAVAAAAPDYPRIFQLYIRGDNARRRYNRTADHLVAAQRLAYFGSAHLEQEPA